MSTKSATAEKIYDSAIVEEVAAIGERVKGAVKETVGSFIGNKEMEREGKQENLEGRLRQENNEVLPNNNSCNTR